MTIVEAITKVLSESKKPMTHNEIYSEIIRSGYYSFGAKDPVSIVRNKIRKHCVGLDFPSSSPKKIFQEFVSDGKKKPSYIIWDGNSTLSRTQHLGKKIKELLPEEIIHIKHAEHRNNLKTALLDEIINSDPSFFESLVVKLLLRMGYGWDESLAGKVVGGSGDEGIDGVIHEDKLGLEKIYVQAKRYSKNNIPPNEIREFIGAMNMQGARKGVFFSTSSFTEQSRSDAKKAQAMNITLVDGIQLCELLVQHGMGVAEVSSYSVYEIDKNFFDY